MDHLAAASGRFSSREEEAAAEAEEEDASNSSSSRREISFMPAAASTSASAPPGDAAAGASGSGGGSADAAVEKEHMFDKVVTPSDVGKLNRLVIPKQYAEKYFPLGSSAGSEKGLLLTFEDAAGKSWRFRYSYWNSSQSYVMTKGWSRFVKDKRLLAGDTVSFSRAAAEHRRLFIDWKRRVDARGPLLRFPALMPHHYGPHHQYAPWGFGAGGVGGGFFMPPSPPATLYEHHRLRQGIDFRAAMSMTYPPPTAGRQLLFFGSSARTTMPPRAPTPLPLHYAVQPSAAAASTRPPLVLDSLPVIDSPTTAAKRVRLFGVNLDNNNPRSDSGGGREASHHQGNALSLQMPDGWQQRTPPTLRLLELPRHGGGAESSAASSPSSSSSSKREARSSALDLDL
ncbi:unnamed protein product [Urochloa humidicola]